MLVKVSQRFKKNFEERKKNTTLSFQEFFVLMSASNNENQNIKEERQASRDSLLFEEANFMLDPDVYFLYPQPKQSFLSYHHRPSNG